MTQVRSGGACPKCGQAMERIAHGELRVELPEYCYSCCLLVFGEDVVQVSARGMQDLKTARENHAQEALEAAQKDSEFSARKYFERVFNFGFTEGFLRSYYHFRHRYKTGRLRRLQALWEKGRKDPERGMFLNLPASEVEEFDKLMMLKTSERSSAKT